MTYLRFGSAGGNPDTRADTHMWEFSYELPMKKTLFVTRPAVVLLGLVSVICPTLYAAREEFESKHGKGAWHELSLEDALIKKEKHFQKFPQHMIVTDVDDRKQSLQWNGYPKREIEKALTVLAQLVFISQSSYALNKDARSEAKDGFYPDTLRLSLALPNGTAQRYFLAPKTKDQTPTSHRKGEILPNYLL